MDTSLILVGANILATLFSTYWLGKKNDSLKTVIETQSKIIEDQKAQITGIKTFTEILEKYVNTSDIEKLLDTKKKIMEHDNEIILREKMKKMSEVVSKEAVKKIQLIGQATYGNGYNELANFAADAFRKMEFEDKTTRNIVIKEFMPTLGESFIRFLDGEPPSELELTKNDL